MDNSINAENGVIRSIINDNNNFHDVCEKIKFNDFFFMTNKLLFKAISEVIESNKKADITTIHEKVKNDEVYIENGGIDLIKGIMQDNEIDLDCKTCADIIKELSLCRRISAINTDGSTSKEKIESLEKEIDEIKSSIPGDDNWIVDAGESIKMLIENIDRAASSDGSIAGLSTGFDNLDEITNGLEKKKMYIVGARPAMGKTAFALNIVKNLLINSNKSVVFFSLEMPHEDVSGRIISMMSRVDSIKMNRANVEAHEWDSVGISFNEYKSKKISIVDKPGISVSELKSYCKKHVKKHGNLDVVVIDYLQLMSESRYKANRVQEVSYISRSLKEISKEFNCPLIALSQLNRGLEGRIDKKPILSDLREAGDIEQDADTVMFLHREEVYNPNDYNLKGKAEVLVRKNRGGVTGDIAMNFNGSIYEFSEVVFDGSYN